MNVLRRSMVLAVLLSCLIGRIANAAEEDTIEVVATGIGQDSDRALRNALRAAIEQAVGTLVDSQTIAKNDEVINDQILSYSGGFVESHKVIGEPKTIDGLVSVKIIAQIKRTELSEKLAAAAVHVSDVDGESLFGEAITKIEKNQAAGDIIKNAVKGFPANVMEIQRIDKPEYDEQSKKWKIKIEISVNREKYRTFTKKLIPILQKIATDSKRVTIGSHPEKTHLKFSTNASDLTRGFNYRVCTQVNDARTSTIWEIFSVPEDIIKAAHSVTRKLTFTVDIVDGRDDIVASGTYGIPSPCGFESYGGWVALYAPVFMEGGDIRSFDPGTDKVTYVLSFDISPNEFKRMKNIVCRIDG